MSARFNDLLHELADEYALLEAELRRWKLTAKQSPLASNFSGLLAVNGDGGNNNCGTPMGCGDASMNSSLLSDGCAKSMPLALTPQSRRMLNVDKKLVDVKLPKALRWRGKNVIRETRAVLPSQLKILPRWTELYVSSRSEATTAGMEATMSHVSSDFFMPSAMVKSASTLSFAGHLLSEYFGGCFIHPSSRRRLVWDLLALLVTVYDVFTTTLQTSMDLEPPTAGAGYVLSMMVTMFWSADIIMNMFTAYVDQGSLVTSNSMILMHYFRSWFLFDATVTLVDWILIVGYGAFDFVRSARVFRIMRLLRTLRLIKTVSITQTVEDLLFGCGQEWQLLVWSVIKILTGILWLGHFMTCFWYFIGTVCKGNGLDSWLYDIEDVELTSDRYAVSLHWITGHLTAAPVDATIGPRNNYERAFTVFVILLSLLVLGYGLTRVTTTLQEFGGRTRQQSEARWQLRKYLKASGVPLELSVRIVRFTNDAFERREIDKPVALTWLNSTLLTELVVSQRSKAVLVHPLPALLHEYYDAGFRRFCTAVRVYMFDMDEKLFHEGDAGETMHITTQGSFKLIDHSALIQDSEVGPHQWFSELALYTHWTHKSTLKAMTFAEAYGLSSQDLSQALRDDPSSAVVVYEYAIELLKLAQNISLEIKSPKDGTGGTRRRSFVSETIGIVKITDWMPVHLPQEAAAFTRPKDARHRATKNREPERQVDLNPFVKRALEGQLYDNEILMQLPLVFEELSETNGIYALTSTSDEAKRATCSIMSVLWLLRNDYDSFTASQKDSVKLAPELWDQLQQFVHWANLTQELVATLMVYLTIRGVGKVRAVTKVLPKDHCTPEAATFQIIDFKPELIPTMRLLGPQMRALIQSTLITQSIFNFFQMLQGENNPRAVLELQQHLQEEDNDRLLKFYLFAVVGVMCGVNGHETVTGSTFMSSEKATNIVRGLQCLQTLGSSSPQAIYWTCITSQAAAVGLCPCESPEDLALARLVCLLRASKEDLVPLRTTWCELQRTERAMLTAHLLADGIGDVAIMFIYLPLFFANSRKNPCVGIYRALILLVDLIELVHGRQEVSEEPNQEVDIYELATVAKETKCPLAFDLAAERIRLMPVGRTLQVQIMDRGLEHTDREKLDTLTHAMRRMGRHMYGFGLYPVSHGQNQGFVERDWLGTVSNLREFGRGEFKMKL